MSKIIMYAHGGSGNHGCEAIVRSTCTILSGNEFPKKILISSSPEEDTTYGISALCEVICDKSTYSKKSMSFLKAYLTLKMRKDYLPLDALAYQHSVNGVEKGDIALSIGGDNYCYADVEKYRMLHDMFLKKKAKTVLWGCSIEPERIAHPAIANDLARYSLITARETMTYEAVKAVNPNTVLVSDPAFCLDTVSLPLPDGFAEGNTVGVNISPMVIENETSPGMAMANYRSLIAAIIKETDMQIALIPHVVWSDGDDRIPLKQLYDLFSNTGRVVMISDCNCMELKGYISRCRFFVGARTHATIAAYSSCVPTLVVGYSVKAKGIATDIFGTYKNYVIPVQRLKESETLSNCFHSIIINEEKIRRHLNGFMPGYCEKASDAQHDMMKLGEMG